MQRRNTAVAPRGRRRRRSLPMGAFGVDLSAMDTSVKPGDDFYRYVNGKWPSTALRSLLTLRRLRHWHRRVVREDRGGILHAILDELAASKAVPPWAAWTRRSPICMPVGWTKPGSRRAASSRLQPFLAQIDVVKDKAGLMGLVGSIDFQAPFGVSILTGHRGSDPLHGVGRSVRARHAEPRLLSEGRARSSTPIARLTPRTSRRSSSWSALQGFLRRASSPNR